MLCRWPQSSGATGSATALGLYLPSAAQNPFLLLIYQTHAQSIRILKKADTGRDHFDRAICLNVWPGLSSWGGGEGPGDGSCFQHRRRPQGSLSRLDREG